MSLNSTRGRCPCGSLRTVCYTLSKEPGNSLTVMRQSRENPRGNALPPGVSEADISRTIEMSGYPVQGRVAALLKGAFYVTEEWGYTDRETESHRSLDIFAHRKVGDGCSIDLLVECKRADLPYVFFRSVVERQYPGVPAIAGIPGDGITLLYNRKGYSTSVVVPPAAILFGDAEPHNTAASLSAMHRKGSGFELSGSVPFNKTVLPLANAVDYCMATFGSASRDVPLPRLLLPIAVIDGPLIRVEHPNSLNDPLLQPWIRVVRQESHGRHPKRRFYEVDFVHIEFMEQFITEYVLPMANTFADRVNRLGLILRDGAQVSSPNRAFEELFP
jgi:hypothetical protein